MTNPTLSQTKRKIFKNWQDSEKVRVRIFNQQIDQTEILTTINGIKPKRQSFSKFIDLTTSWINLNLIEDANPIESCYMKWEVEINNISMVQTNGLKHNINFRFGSGEELIDAEFDENTTILTAFHMEPNSSETSLTEPQNFIKFFFGFYMNNSNGLLELNNGLQTRLSLTLTNPYYYL